MLPLTPRDYCPTGLGRFIGARRTFDSTRPESSESPGLRYLRHIFNSKWELEVTTLHCLHSTKKRPFFDSFPLQVPYTSKLP